MSCKDCLNRREFLTKSALATAAAALVAGCGNGVIGVPERSTVPSGNAVTVKVSNFPGLATVGTIVKISAERAAVRTGPTTFLGLSMICTHEQCDTEITSANIFHCPCHDSRFANDGSVINGPAASPLAHLQTTYNQATDELTVA
jgi:Rieske Fe-S protein